MSAPTAWRQLEEALDDDLRIQQCSHKQLILALQNGHLQRARELAEKLDRVAGPHIEFEERYIYPLVEDRVGEAYLVRLAEQQFQVLRALVELQTSVMPSELQSRRWRVDLHQGGQYLHASEHLLQQLPQLGDWQLIRLWDKLLCLRQIGHRWSQLHPLRAEHLQQMP